jgi:hypothetical protein
MVWDIAIAVAAGLCQLLTALLGWRITTNPLDLNDPKQRRRLNLYNALFVSAGVVGVFFIGLAAYRVPREHAHFAFQTQTTYQGPSSIPSWSSGTGERRAEFLMVNSPLAFNLWYTNVGPGVATDVKTYGASFIEPDNSISSLLKNPRPLQL